MSDINFSLKEIKNSYSYNDVVSSWFISVSDYDIYLKDSASWYGLDDILIEQKNNLISFITK